MPYRDLAPDHSELAKSVAAIIPDEGVDSVVEYLAMHPDKARIPAIIELVDAIEQAAKLRPQEQRHIAIVIGTLIVSRALQRLEMAH